MNNKVIQIVGGGTISHIRSHLALCAPAYGTTARRLAEICKEKAPNMDVNLHLTKMADYNSTYETNEDLLQLALVLSGIPETKIVFWNPAMCDFTGHISGEPPITQSEFERKGGKKGNRLSSEACYTAILHPDASKVVGSIRKQRKDITLVAFKTTTGASPFEQYEKGLHLLKRTSANLVLANDVVTRNNLIVVPEEAIYAETKDRTVALEQLVDIALLRSQLTFTRSTVVAGEPIPWSSGLVPESLRTVVDHCIARGAYKQVLGVTAGHFAAKINDHTFLTSRRKTNLNDINNVGLVKITTDGPDSVIAYGSKPSVGGQSQRIVFQKYPALDCIVHFHCLILPGSEVPIVSQREYECGSHQCGQNTANGLRQFGNLYAVYLDNHGPNIVFPGDINPNEVLAFIDQNFDLTSKSGGCSTLHHV
jgi:hypothetical protein